MRIRMLETRRGAADGFTVRDYLAGEEYDLSAGQRAVELAQVFVREGWAAEVRPASAADLIEADTPRSNANEPTPTSSGTRTASAKDGRRGR